MKKYIKNGISIYVNSLIPFPGYLAMAVYGAIFWRKEYEKYLISENKYDINLVNKVVNHEGIHKCQMLDFCKWLPLGGTIFYIMYILEWIVRLFVNGPGKAYKMMSFEQEAKQNETNMDYQKSRERFAFYKNMKWK